MKYADITQELVPFLAEAADKTAEQVQLESHLLEDLEMDSLSVLELTVFTEDTFGVGIEDDFKKAMNDPTLRRGMSVQWLIKTIGDRRENHDS